MEDKRRYRRIPVEGISGNMMFASRAKIINISLSGAAMQIDVNLKIGKEYTIRLEGKDKHLTLKGTIVWSVLSGSQKGPHGDVVPIYNAGIEFSNVLTDQTKEMINFIEGHKVRNIEDRLRGLRFRIHAPERTIVDYSLGYRVKLISLGGMLIETMQRFNPEERFPMDITLRDGKNIQFTGRVASCIEIKDKHPVHYDIGVEFMEMSEENKEKIREFIKTLDK